MSNYVNTSIELNGQTRNMNSEYPGQQPDTPDASWRTEAATPTRRPVCMSPETASDEQRIRSQGEWPKWSAKWVGACEERHRTEAGRQEISEKFGWLHCWSKAGGGEVTQILKEMEDCNRMLASSGEAPQAATTENELATPQLELRAALEEIAIVKQQLRQCEEKNCELENRLSHDLEARNRALNGDSFCDDSPNSHMQRASFADSVDSHVSVDAYSDSGEEV